MSDLRLDPRNARRHPDRNKAMIRQALEQIGAFRSIAVDGDDIIRAGNGVYEQAQALGLKVRVVEAGPDELIAVKRPDLVGELAERAAILDNAASDSSEWDAGVLAWLKENQPEAVEGLWDEKEWRGLLNQLNDEKPGEDDTTARPDLADELRQQWDTQPGQVWIIPSKTTPGKSHRLMCGDSTDPEQVRRLMAGQRAVLFATDPPYLVDYTGDDRPKPGKDWSDVYHDWDNPEQGVALYDGFIAAAIAEAITQDAAWYCVFIRPMQQHTYPGDLVYEPFSGSGSQLVAAEMIGRLCFAMEKAPEFVAVGLQRLADMGLEPGLEK